MMIEWEWPLSTNPRAMLRHVLGGENVYIPEIYQWTSPRLASDRKLRLLACACHEVARQDTVGALHDEEALQAAYAYADDPSRPLPFIHSHWTFAVADAEHAARQAVEANYKGSAPSLLRCIFGNPWRKVEPLRRWRPSMCKVCEARPDAEGVIEHGRGCYMESEDGGGTTYCEESVSPWLTWHDGTVVKLAQSIYDNRDFSAMPILADALEEAGCANEDILRHCREGGLHGRGCWVVDLLLGK